MMAIFDTRDYITVDGKNYYLKENADKFIDYLVSELPNWRQTSEELPEGIRNVYIVTGDGICKGTFYSAGEKDYYTQDFFDCGGNDYFVEDVPFWCYEDEFLNISTETKGKKIKTMTIIEIDEQAFLPNINRG